MKFYNKCVCCGKKIEVFPEEYDCLEDLNEPMVCSEECNEEMEARNSCYIMLCDLCLLFIG